MSTRSSIKWNPSLTDENEAYVVVIATTVMTALIILSTSMRIGMKLWCRLPLQIEDFLIVISLGINLASNAIEYESVKVGFGRHLQFLTRDQERALRRWNQIALCLANLAIWSVKLSICFFILSLIRGTYRRSRWVIYGLITITCIAHGSQTIVWATQARPLEKLWHPEVPGTVRTKKTLVNSIIAFTAISSVTDLFYAILPIYFFGNLQMSLQKKITVLALTGSGLLVFAASIIRVGFVNDFKDPDMSWALRRVYVCTIVERNLAEFIADLPAIFPLIRSMHKKVVTVITQGSRGTSKSGSYGPTNSLTIGSEHKRLHNGKRGKFAAYGPNGQFTTIHDNSDDEIPLKDGLNRPSSAAKKNERGITVQVNIDVESQEHNDSRPVWPKGSLRPKV
ncbi:uncharacterized protein BDR25DRAFT_261093 [Lindgomyces ingoldianus]|uniref:Uncharacterized protein n=1 Tax=Lindgomyces ingoldianus TaxID=673940 RepID=A0ACB6QXF4_9PLEO|nr:uncharacterized protein BDR25DRAFT_261093 [Lindgomyces ingoldianus]KAF2471482.1 hypothetical protein BDR25DRAFT_261093 [Lindgomyces ingoldianus]